MEEISLKICDVLQDNSSHKTYRILFIKGEQAVLCQMNCPKLIIFPIGLESLMKSVTNGRASILAQTRTVVDAEDLSTSCREIYERNLEIARKIESIYGPDFLQLTGKGNKPEIEEMIQSFHVSRKTLWRIIRRYLQGGFDVTQLADKRNNVQNSSYRKYRDKPGRKTESGIPTGLIVSDEVSTQFEEALRYYKSGRAMTFEAAYDYLCQQHYMRIESHENSAVQVLCAASERPTFRQFYYYCTKHITAEDKDAIKTSKREQRNDKRLLFSDNLYGVMGPCDCFEMDEVEVDISLLSEMNPNKVIGRPVVYVMLDVYTRMIMAVSIGLDNNCILAFSNCMLNLADNKIAFCQKYGLTIPERIWPYGYLPKRIRCDRGAEYRSKEVKRICRELGIALELVPAATGSLKGSVEQLFHQMHSAQNFQLENRGLIEKRHDSMHHKEATLTINDFTKIFLHFVVTYNQHYMENYPCTKDMVQKDISPNPIELWEYGLKMFGEPRPIANLDQFRYSLLTPVSAKVDRKGIALDGLYYMNYSDNKLMDMMYTAGAKKIAVEMRMDERDVGALYYLKENELKAAHLNQYRVGCGEYDGMTRAEYLEIRKVQRAKRAEGKEKNRQLRVARTQLNQDEIKNAEKRKKEAQKAIDVQSDSIRENRREEQIRIQKTKRIIDERCETPPTLSPSKASEENFGTSKDMDWKSAMSLFD